MSDDLAGNVQRVGIVLRQMVGDARCAGVHVAAAQFLGTYDFTRGGFDQRRAGEKYRPLVFDDYGLVAHRRHVGATGRAGAHHAGDLRYALGRHIGLVVEDAAEVIAVRKDIVL